MRSLRPERGADLAKRLPSFEGGERYQDHTRDEANHHHVDKTQQPLTTDGRQRRDRPEREQRAEPDRVREW